MKARACALIAAAQLVGGVALAQSPSAPPPATSPPAPPAAAVRPQSLSPEQGIGALYGTSNLRRERQNGVSAEALLLEQNARHQPSATPAEYAEYLAKNTLLQKALDDLKAHPDHGAAFALLSLWNLVALDMTSIDHTTAGTVDPNTGYKVFETTYAEQFGPARASRAMAIVHVAMFEAANAIENRYQSWTPAGASQSIRDLAVRNVGPQELAQASVAVAIDEAAYTTLVALYPRKRVLIDAARLKYQVLIAAETPPPKSGVDVSAQAATGEMVGRQAAKAVLAARDNDNALYPDPTSRCLKSSPAIPDNEILPDPLCREAFWQPGDAQPSAFDYAKDPVSELQIKLGKNWGQVSPWVLAAHQFVTPDGLLLGGQVKAAPTDMSAEFLDAVNNGGYGSPTFKDPHDDNVTWYPRYGTVSYGSMTSATRDGDQTTFARFWGYDGTALLCAPPRLYNMVATSYWAQHMQASIDGKHPALETARYLALINMSMAESAIAAWDAKYTYHVARPVTYLRARQDKPEWARWTPLGQVGSNGLAEGTTPPFPAYPSGHAVFGGALFQMIAIITNVGLTSPESQFEFVSDEYNGQTVGADGKPRPVIIATYPDLHTAEWENAESRIWLGIHWQQDGDDGIALGEQIARTVADRVYAPRPNVGE
jgi:hypothetical protein